MSNTRSDEKHRPLSEAEMRAQMEWMNDRHIRKEIQKQVDNLNNNDDRPLSASSTAALEEKEKKEEKANDVAISASIEKDLREEETQKPQQPASQPVYTKPKGVVSLIPNTSVPHKSNVKKMSDLVIHKIASYLNCKEAHQFFATSRHTHHVMENEKSCISTTFYGKKLRAINSKAIAGILKYISEKKRKHQVFKFASRYYKKGYHRAQCFLDILRSDETSFFTTWSYEVGTLGEHLNETVTRKSYGIELHVRLFALYVLLKESNGKDLKSGVRQELVARFGNNILQEIEANVRQLFGNDLILLDKMEKLLLAKIHDTDAGIGYDCEGDGDDFNRGFMSHYYHVNDLEKESKSTKSKKGGCSIS